MYARRRHVYFTMMGICLTLFVLAWALVSRWSTTAAVAMCAVAMVIPPVAAIVANRKGPEDRWWDEEPGQPRGTGRSGDTAKRPPDSPDKLRPGPHRDPESEAWWEELDGKKRRR
ncbi:DUF3099 domain-containing protein [Streptomyces sp. NA04227]|uniref:DUF3099 domain-containing protein n=1 Tax=Streptomyces sp. NA04227 TaxID=2742136 RepID=UPI001591EFD7|nr:DUF3099 domain-containing protein [Streptomyces sp. NA04227]QKW08178.1 DUF3099 domain-containing protein [Streptomyces sp. NA04227]